MKDRFSIFTVACMLAAFLCATSALAEEPSEAICALQQAAACGEVEVCERALPAAVNLPALMKFDVKDGVVESRFDNGELRSSKISSSSRAEGALILQGIDGSHPWAMRVDATTGEFTLSVLREGEAFVGFGVCSSKILN